MTTPIDLPIVQRAVLTRLAEPGQDTWRIEAAHPVPAPLDTQVLVKTAHVGLNPFDWQSVEFKFGITKEPKVIGRDGAGIVIQVGSKVDRFQKGDRVWFCANSAGVGTGAFQEYSLHDQAELGRTPDNISDVQAATLGTGLITAGVALFRTLGLDLECLVKSSRETSSNKDAWILIWGGAGITGIYLIQLAHLLGFRVICAASPVNHAYVRSLGADVVLDRWDEAEVLVAKLRDATQDNVTIAIDNVGSETAALCHEILRGSSSWQSSHNASTSSEPAKLVALAGLPKIIPEPGSEAIRTVELPRISFSTTFYGKPDFSVRLLDLYRQLLSDGDIKPARTKLVPGGLSGVQAGLAQLKAGKGIGGYKLIITIEKTVKFSSADPSPRAVRKRKPAAIEVEEVIVKRQRVVA